jgi:hypothetical protein
MASASTRLLESIASRWGRPDQDDETPLLVDGVRVGSMRIGSGAKDAAWISTFEVESRFRAQGVGSRLLRELCDMADAAGAAIGLEAFSWGGLPEFYGRFGFSSEDGPSEDGYLEMTRPPGPAPDPDEDPEPDDRRRVADLIAGMAVFCADLPLTAALRPYRNVFAPDLAYPALVLTDLFADCPGRGAGSLYMAELSRRCDEAEIDIYTDAQDERSRDFYLARGFERTTGRRDHQLVRWAPDMGEEFDFEP